MKEIFSKHEEPMGFNEELRPVIKGNPKDAREIFVATRSMPEDSLNHQNFKLDLK